MIEVEVSSRLEAPPGVVWERVASLEGVNDELRPLLRMTAPAGARLDGAGVPLGRRWFRSWLLLGGLLPVDFDDLTLVEVRPGEGFRERSAMLSLRRWEHERALSADGDGTLVVDRLRAQPRVPVPAAIPRALIGAVFRHRHRRLRRRFGGVPA